MKIGILGPPQAGKSTLFSLITTLEGTKQASVVIPDERLDQLERIFCPQKTTYGEITFVDINNLYQEKTKDIQYFIYVSRSFKEIDNVFSYVEVDFPVLVVVNIAEEKLRNGKWKEETGGFLQEIEGRCN